VEVCGDQRLGTTFRKTGTARPAVSKEPRAALAQKSGFENHVNRFFVYIAGASRGNPLIRGCGFNACQNLMSKLMCIGQQHTFKK